MRPSECYQMQKTIETHLPHLSQPQLTGLALWVCRHPRRQRLPERRGLRPLALEQLVQPAPAPQGVALRRRRPRDSLPDRAGRKLRATAAVGPLLVAVGRLGLGHSKATRPPPSSSAWYTAVSPSPWPGTSGTPTSPAPGWNRGLLQALAPAVPENMTVIVLCDRGIARSRYGIKAGIPVCATERTTFCADGGKRLPAQRFVSRPDTAWIGRGTAFSTPKAQRRCTLLVVWYSEQEDPGSSSPFRWVPAGMDRGLQGPQEPGQPTPPASPGTGSSCRWWRTPRSGGLLPAPKAWESGAHRVDPPRDWLRRLLKGRLWTSGAARTRPEPKLNLRLLPCPTVKTLYLPLSGSNPSQYSHHHWCDRPASLPINVSFSILNSTCRKTGMCSK